MLGSYPSIYTIGHKGIQELFTGPIVVEEKVDGSQLSFSADEFGNLSIRSKGKEQYPDTDDLFNLARQSIEQRQELLHPGYIYRGEYLRKPHHNALTYGRIPLGHIVIFDIEESAGTQSFLSPMEKKIEADRIGYETVPMIWNGTLDPKEIVERVTGWVSQTPSFLGNCMVEGVVVKNYSRFGIDKKILIGKWVSEAFKEVHALTWGAPKLARNSFVQELAAKYTTEARWHKAIQHLRDNGELTETPRDIGVLLKEIAADVQKECGDEIRDALFKHFWKDIHGKVTLGFPQWYKQQLLEKAESACQS